MLAVPPQTLSVLRGSSVGFAAQFAKAERPATERVLSTPMATIDLYLTRRMARMPRDHVILLNSRYGLTLIDNAQLWEGVETTALNVAATEFQVLASLPPAVAMKY